MPRARKTQPVQAPQDQGYGVRGEQMAALHQLPLPNNRGADQPVTPPGAQAGPPSVDPAQVLQQAAQMAPPTGALDRPTDRPNEPFTAGLPTGAGPGPEAVGGAVDPVLAYLQAASAAMPGVQAIVALIEAAQAPQR